MAKRKAGDVTVKIEPKVIAPKAQAALLELNGLDSVQTSAALAMIIWSLGDGTLEAVTEILPQMAAQLKAQGK